jgi:hypothetical protein
MRHPCLSALLGRAARVRHKGGKGGGSYAPPAPAQALAQNVSVRDEDAAAAVDDLSKRAKARGYWWTQFGNKGQQPDAGNKFSSGL